MYIWLHIFGLIVTFCVSVVVPECSINMYQPPNPLAKKTCAEYCTGTTYTENSEIIPCLIFEPGFIEIPELDYCACHNSLEVCYYPRRSVCTNPAQSEEQCKLQMRGQPAYWECKEGEYIFNGKISKTSRYYCSAHLKNGEKGLLDTWSMIECKNNTNAPTYAPTTYAQSFTDKNNFWNIYSYRKWWLWVWFFLFSVIAILLLLFCLRVLCVCRIKICYFCKHKKIACNVSCNLIDKETSEV